MHLRLITSYYHVRHVHVTRLNERRRNGTRSTMTKQIYPQSHREWVNSVVRNVNLPLRVFHIQSAIYNKNDINLVGTHKHRMNRPVRPADFITLR